jgi:hypothetical protein
MVHVFTRFLSSAVLVSAAGEWQVRAVASQGRSEVAKPPGDVDAEGMELGTK